MADRVKGGDPKTDQEGTTRTPGWHPEEKAPCRVLSLRIQILRQSLELSKKLKQPLSGD